MMRVSGAAKVHALTAMAESLQDHRDTLKAANRQDLDAARTAGLTAALLDPPGLVGQDAGPHG